MNIFRSDELSVQADAKAAAEAIVGRRSNEIAAKIATAAENPDPKPYTPTPGTLDPRHVLKEVDGGSSA